MKNILLALGIELATIACRSETERLRREAMAAAVLDHPCICKIFEIGQGGDASGNRFWVHNGSHLGRQHRKVLDAILYFRRHLNGEDI